MDDLLYENISNKIKYHYNNTAISPRDWPAYHSHILTQRRDIIADIRSMFREQIQSKFPLDDCK